ncbi:MAG TPA: hypothetical protein VLT62_22360 [Candidatus Methylomirabilis sp.]|nr:hypothetical protein [Candidatus Methylomirabilis sp.]
MKAHAALFSGLIAILLGGYIASEIVSAIPGPGEISITPPSPDLAPDVAALSGAWETVGGAVGPHRVVVERIDETWATILYAWPDHPAGHSKGGWQRVSARVLGHGELRWGYPVRFTLRIAEDGATLESKVERAGAAAMTTLKRLEPARLAAGPTL